MEALVWMTGRVGGDVDVRESASPWSTFRLACTPRVVRGGEWGDEQTTWVTVSCSHRLAEHVRLSLRKGDPVIVVGKLRTRRWFDANGLEHEQLQIRASSVGHDLAVGTSSFYRPRRDGTAEPAAEEGAGSPDSDGGEPLDEDAIVEFDEPESLPRQEPEDPDGEQPGGDATVADESGGEVGPPEDRAVWQVQPATPEKQSGRRRGSGRAA